MTINKAKTSLPIAIYALPFALAGIFFFLFHLEVFNRTAAIIVEALLVILSLVMFKNYAKTQDRYFYTDFESLNKYWMMACGFLGLICSEVLYYIFKKPSVSIYEYYIFPLQFGYHWIEYVQSLWFEGNVIAPIFEELIYRLPLLILPQKRYVFLSALCFAISHYFMGTNDMMRLFFMALLLSAVCLHFRSVIPCMLIHFLMNASPFHT